MMERLFEERVHGLLEGPQGGLVPITLYSGNDWMYLTPISGLRLCVCAWSLNSTHLQGGFWKQKESLFSVCQCLTPPTQGCFCKQNSGLSVESTKQEVHESF